MDDTDRCPDCGTPHAPHAKFCAECGSSLARLCASCAAPSSGGRFCAECGAAFEAGSASAATAAPVSERRVVSLLFGDLVGFTTVSEQRDPEAVRELLSAYFERSRAIVERYGGTVEKFIGDAVFGVWGVPAAHEDDAERAVRAGLELTAAAAQLGEEIGVEGLQMRVGVTTGQVAVTLGVVGEGMVAGDAVNTAARVQSVAQPGQVWVDDTTRSLSVAAIAYVPVGSFNLKGKAVAVDLFHATRTVAAVGGEQRVDGLEAEFVGRERELRLVKELFHQTFDDGRARIVLVAGEPGAGTSRLAWEFEKYTSAITSHRTWWLRGRCLSYGQAAGGRVLAELVRSHLRVTEGDPDADVEAALDRRLQEHFSDAADRDELRPKLASLLGLSSRHLEQADLFVSLRRLLEAMTSDGSSVTIVVDDLQWADDAFLDFVDHLLEAARAPIMVLGLTRPELMERRPGFAAGRRATTVFLDRMADSALALMLDSMVDGLTPALRSELVRRAEGMPLYAVETVRALVDRDVIIPSGGRYVLAPNAAPDLASLGPPASLQALLAARLDALPDIERRLVQDASVLGLTFSRAGVVALAPEAMDVDAALEGLRRKEILALDIDPRSPERGSYRFVQALLRSVAYDTLSRRDKHARHLAAAAHLAAIGDGGSDTLPAVQAAHLLDARAAWPETDGAEGLVTQAALLFEQAVEDARQLDARHDAMAHLLALLALPIADDQIVRHSLTLARVHDQIRAREGDVEPVLERGRQLAIDLGDRLSALTLGSYVGNMRSRRSAGTHDALLEEVFAEAVDRSDAAEALALSTYGLIYDTQLSGSTDHIERAFVQLLRATRVVEQYGRERDFQRILGALSVAFGVTGQRRLAAVIGGALSDLYDAGDPEGVIPLMNLVSHQVGDRPADAERGALEALRRVLTLGMTANLSAVLSHVMYASHATGHWQHAEAAVAQAREVGHEEPEEWAAFGAAGSALLAWGRRDPALQLPRPTEWHEEELVNADLERHRAVEMALAGDVTAAARTALRAAATMAGSAAAYDDVHPVLALTCDLLIAAADTGGLHELGAVIRAIPPGQRGRLNDACVLRLDAHLGDEPVPLLTRATASYEAAGAGYWAAHVRVELAAAMLATGDVGGAEAALDEALPLLVEIGAVGDLVAAEAIRGAGAPQGTDPSPVGP